MVAASFCSGFIKSFIREKDGSADFVLVESARLEDGLLIINLLREVPEAMKPRKIAIDGQGSLSLIAGGKTKSEAA